MSGQPGRSGRLRKPLAYHLANGTYRPGRHGPLPADAPGSPPEPLDAPQALPAAVGEGLTGRGLAFVQAAWDAYSGWRVEKLLLLREAGLLIQQLEAARGTKAEGPLRRALLTTLAQMRFDQILLESPDGRAAGR